MGTQATKIVAVDLKELVEDLRRAYADEWLATQGYTYMAQIAAGQPAAAQVAAALKEIAADELEHQEELAERIAVLGGRPPKDFQEIVKSANAPFPPVPEDSSALEKMMRVTIAAERDAIEVYQKIAAKCQGKDFLTYDLAVHILGEEVEHEDRFQSMLS